MGGKRRMMKEELLRGINQRQLKSSKRSCKSSKNGAPCPGPGPLQQAPLEVFDCISVLDVCENTKSAKTPSEGKSGKSGPTSPSEGKTGKSGPTSPSCGKSGKSNGGSGDCAGPTAPSVTCVK